MNRPNEADPEHAARPSSSGRPARACRLRSPASEARSSQTSRPDGICPEGLSRALFAERLLLTHPVSGTPSVPPSRSLTAEQSLLPESNR